MENFQDWMHPALIWFVIGLILLIIEFINPGIVIIFFGLGAWVVALICLFLDISINVQLVVFLITSLLFLVSLRKWFKQLFVDRFVEDIGEEDEDDMIGKQAVVIKAIKPRVKGRVEFRGSHWDAESEEELPKGSNVEIVSKNNITLTVKSI